MAKVNKEITISVPLFVMIPRKTMPDKKYIINLNYYRNWMGIVNNNIKKGYKELVLPQVQGLSFNNIEVTLTLFKATKRKTDRANVLSIHEKFFCDALVEAGCLPDDNDSHLVATHYYSGGLDRDNPRVEIAIKEVS